MQYYYAQVDNYYVNYLFKKDMSFMRLKDTKFMNDTIIYDSKQIKLLRKMHPDMITLSFGRAIYDRKEIKLKKKLTDNHVNSIIKYLN